MIKKTLVVNDDNTSLLIVCKMINKARFADETLTAVNGQLALDYFEKAVAQGKAHFDAAPEFIFLDMYMPIMNGWDFLDIFSKKYAHLFPGVKIAVVSSSVDPEDMVRLEKYGVVLASVTTPMSLEKLNIVKEMYLNQQHPGLCINNNNAYLN